jgi:hypothetical protein
MQRRMIALLILTLYFQILTAPPNPVIYIAESNPLKDQRLLNAIIQVESGGNPLQVNFGEQAMGLLQIRPVMLNEVNRILEIQGKNQRYTIKDALDSIKSIQMYWIVQNYHNAGNDFKSGAILWNGRSKHNHYWGKIKKLI